MTGRRGSYRGRRRRTLAFAVAAALALGIAGTSAAAPPPQRIASIYLCADQLLLLLAERECIVTLSRFAVQPSISHQAAAAKDIPGNRGRAEELLLHAPDLILAGEYTAPATKAMLRKIGLPVVELPTATDFDAIRANIRRVAAAIDRPERGDRLVEALDRRLDGARPGDKARASLMLYRLGGFSHGRGTLLDAIFRTVGFANHSAARVSGVGRLSLESVLVDPPDAIVLGQHSMARDSQAAELLSHPAFRHLRERTPAVVLPDALWICGLPASAEAAEVLADFRRSIAAPARRGTARPK